MYTCMHTTEVYTLYNEKTWARVDNLLSTNQSIYFALRQSESRNLTLRPSECRNNMNSTNTPVHGTKLFLYSTLYSTVYVLQSCDHESCIRFELTSVVETRVRGARYK